MTKTTRFGEFWGFAKVVFKAAKVKEGNVTRSTEEGARVGFNVPREG